MAASCCASRKRTGLETHGSITFSTDATSVVVPVTWKLYEMPRLEFSKDPIAFQWRVGDPPPAPKKLEITCPTLNPDYFYAGTPLPSFLKVDPRNGTTPATVPLTADPTGLAPGVHETKLEILGGTSLSKRYDPIPVTLTIVAGHDTPPATVARAVDAASYLAGGVAPGQIMVLFGSGLGPADLTTPQLGPDLRFPKSLAGWTVYFDDLTAPVIYLSENQSAVVAPFGIAGRATTSLTVETAGTRSAPVVLPVVATNPAIFTADASGAGIPAATVMEEDGSFTVLSASNPAARGGIVTFYASGLGTTTPFLDDGAPAGVPLATLNAPVRVLVGDIEADVLYAGPAPSQIAGLFQINIRVPANVPAGSPALLVVADEKASQPGVTLPVR